MEWYNYVSAFFSAVFLTNAVPHFVNGISGNAFPTPFAKPPGKGLSSPVTNIAWALLNIFIGSLLFKFSKIFSGDVLLQLLFFAGIIFVSFMLANTFSKKKSNVIDPKH